jgi:hypothetical protein
VAVHTSLNAMVQRIHGLADTTEASEWESTFVKDVFRKTLGGRRTTVLNEKEIEKVEEIFKKHFAA